MCLAIPGKIISLQGDGLERSAKVDFAGARRVVNLALTPEAGLGDYVLVHVGFAIAKLDRAEADRSIKLIEDLAP